MECTLRWRNTGGGLIRRLAPHFVISSSANTNIRISANTNIRSSANTNISSSANTNISSSANTNTSKNIFHKHKLEL